jgi:hypothetical protein
MNRTIYNEYRITFPNRYSAGSKASDRQGYYILAVSEQEAIEKAPRRYSDEPVEVELWKQDFYKEREAA